MYLDSFDRSMIHFLATTSGWHNTNEIADKCRMSWNTAEEHLQRLKHYQYVKTGRKGERVYWKINR